MMQERRSVPDTVLSVLPTAFLLLVGFFIFGGCGGDVPANVIPGLKADQPVIDEASVAEMEADEFFRVVADATDGLIEHLGGDEAAFYATLLALDQGYDIFQLLTGSLNDRVEADGSIRDTDGSVLSPACPAEGIVQPSSGSSSSGADSTSARSSARPILVASLSGPSLMVAALGDMDDRTVVLANAFLPLPDVYLMAREMWSEHQQGFEEDFVEDIAGIAIALAARGYGVQQILEGILLDRLRIDPTREFHGSGDEYYACFHIEHSPGVILRPVHPPVDILVELSCPGATKDAPTSFSPEEVKAAVADAVGDETAQGGEAAKLESRQKVSITLAPYVVHADSGMAITSHEVVMDIEPGEYAGYDFTCRWRIELVQGTTTHSRYEEGTTFVCVGEAYTEEPSVQSLGRIHQLSTDYTWTAVDPAGELIYEVQDSGKGFGGRLDEDLKGDGWFGNVGPAMLNWDTFSGALPKG